MTRAVTYLGRKFLFCAGCVTLILIGSIVAPHEAFAAGCAAIVAICGIFCGTNTLAGIKGLPGKSAEDKKDGSDASGSA